MKRKLGLAIVVGLTVLLGIYATQVRFDTSIEVWFLEDDPDLLTYRDFTETFASDQIVVFAWEDPELWTAEGLRFLWDAGEQLGAVQDVQAVRSMVRLDEIVASPGSLSTGPMYDPEDPPDPLELKERVLSDELIVGSLIGEEGTTAAIILTVDPLLGTTRGKTELAADLHAVADRLEAERGLEIARAGPTLLDAAFLQHTQRDSMLILPLMFLVIVFAILALFRSGWALLLPVSVVLVDSVWVTGVTALLGQELTIIHGIVYPLLLGVGIATSIHLLSRTLLLRRGGAEPKQAASDALSQLLVPSFFTAATTVAGLSSLNFSTLAPLRHFGQLGAFGVFCAFVLNYALGPWLLPIVASKHGRGGVDDTALDRLWSRWDRGLAWLGRLALERAGRVMAISTLLLLFGFAGLSFLKLGSNPVNYYRAADPVRIAIEFVDARLAGTTTLEIVVDSGEVNGALEPEFLRGLRTVQEWLDSVEGVGMSVSLADYVMELRRALRGGAAAERRIPDSRAEVAQLLLLLDDPEELERMVANIDYQETRITATVRATESEKLTGRIPELEELLAETFPPPASTEATGMSKLIANMDRYLLHSATRSMGLAFITVLIFMTLALRSVRLGLFSMIPNILPVALVIGVMGWCGIALDPGTTMIGAVALGLVVDNTVHFLHHLRRRIFAGDDLETAVHDTLMKTGRAVVTTSIVLTCGFWLMLFASFNPNIYFGLLCGLAILFGLVADLVMLPAALLLVKPRLSS